MSVSPAMGAYVQDNWIAANRGGDPIEIHEYPLYTDARITGQIDKGLGPYQLLNALNLSLLPSAPSVVLRFAHYVAFDPAQMQGMKTDVTRYHGGVPADEVAALVSLCLGIRLKAGPENRIWSEAFKDPKGIPVYMKSGETPVLLRQANRTPMLPSVLGERSLNDAVRIKTLPTMVPPDTVALVRAARLYQDGLWIAESQPGLSWLMLVSAIESAAGHWRTQTATPVERLAVSRPELIAILRAAGGDEHVKAVADVLAPYLGAKTTFVDFVLAFNPGPPPDSPEAFLQVSWADADLKKAMEVIYNWRSRALHGGIPFPVPMCEPPINLGQGYAEKPVGVGRYARNAFWPIDKTPMLLHTFEYIVRKTLLAWWQSLIPSEGPVQ